jgi:D-alanyl-D-alanine carboxypeptidase (penicillin-binding protein 5/6)
VAVLLLVILIGALVLNYLRPIPPITTEQVLPSTTAQGTPPSIPWPADGQAAIGAQDVGVVAASANAKSLPIASVAKVMTALVVLDAKPLKKGELGPAIPVTEADVADYQRALANKESTVKVQLGESLSEYQALQGLLIPSGNNLASMLARWSLGSTDAFVSRMNEKARQLGMTQTRFADVSGISPSTVSVPSDLVRLGGAGMQNPVVADIVGQQEVSLPGAARAPNVNAELGKHGIVGIKTGNIPEVGAVYLVAATAQLAGGRNLLLFAAVQGPPTLDAAFKEAEALLEIVRSSLQVKRVVGMGQVVGRYQSRWGESTELTATGDVDMIVWPGAPVHGELRAPAVSAPVLAGTKAGSLRLQAGDQTYDLPLVTGDRLNTPSPFWRAFRLH